MQLLSVGLARSIWVFDVNDLNPTGKNFLPEFLPWLGEKYSFQTAPKSIADADKEKKGFIFQAGEFQSAEGPLQVNFSFFSDGIVAETWSSTEHGDAFLEEVLRLAVSKYGLTYNPDMVQRKSYISELVVQLDHLPAEINPRIAGFCEKLNKLFARHHLAPFEMTGMLFAPDVLASSYKPPGLLIERKQGAPFAQNRFWSKSPFTTKDHLFALEEFEKLLADAGGTKSTVEMEGKRAVRLAD
jgi:hypothetical protein